MTKRSLALFTITVAGTLAPCLALAQQADWTPPPNPYNGASPQTPAITSPGPAPSNVETLRTGTPSSASTATTASGAPSDYTSYATARETPPVQPRCTPRIIIPIRGQLGPDGSYRATRAPTTPTAVGGGPCVESTTSSSSAPPPSTSSAAPMAPRPVTTTTTTTATQPLHSSVDEQSSSMTRTAVVARGGGPVTTVPVAMRTPPAAETVYVPPTRLDVRTPRPRVARFMLGVGGGTGMYTNENDPHDLGAAWHTELGVEFVRVVTLEARYQGAWNRVPVGVDPSRPYSLVSSGVTGLLRLAIPTRYVLPYVHGGLGYSWYQPTGAVGNTQAAPIPTGLAQVPVGGGLEFRVTRAIGIDLEYTYQFLLDSRWTFDHTSHPWGDSWNAGAGVRFYL